MTSRVFFWAFEFLLYLESLLQKQGSTDWSPRPTVYGPITKDEAEVAETLYALAGMFPGKCLNNKSELVGESLPENSSVLHELEEGTNTAFDGSFHPYLFEV